MLSFQKKRIRVAAFGDNLKAQKPHGWRAVIAGHEGVIPLTHVTVVGTITPENQQWKFANKADQYGIIAWVEYFGDIDIDHKDAARITLL